MSFGQTILLGFIAGATILLGLPVARLQKISVGAKVMLSSLATGVLLFLFWDILSQAWAPVKTTLSSENFQPYTATFYMILVFFGIAAGLLPLVWYEKWFKKKSTTKPAKMTKTYQLALFIAVGIGLHNFAEGLAIGQSSASGQISLAVMLIVGFALHNATEGFGVAAPLAGQANNANSPKPTSWFSLLFLGLVAGGPTVLGTALGYSFISVITSIIFLAIAAGSILYVVLQLIIVAAKANRGNLLAYGILTGLCVGFITDAVITAAGTQLTRF